MEDSKESIKRLLSHLDKSKLKIKKISGDYFELEDDIKMQDLEVFFMKLSKKYKINPNDLNKHLLNEVSNRPIKFKKLLEIVKLFYQKKIEDIRTRKKKLIRMDTNLNSNRSKLTSVEVTRLSFEDFSSRVASMLPWLNKKIEKSILKALFSEFLSICKIVVEASDLKSLWGLRKKPRYASKDLFSSEDIQDWLSDWFNEFIAPQDLRAKVMKTIREYEEARENMISIDEKNSFDALIYSLRTQLKKIPSKSVTIVNNFLDKAKAGISEVFKYYSKQQFLIGKNPTFEVIQKNLEIWTVGKFIKFCKDFGIIEPVRNDKRSRKKAKLIEKIFKENSDFNRDMHEHQFFAALDMLACYHLDADYDSKHATEWKNMPIEEKRTKFYEILGFHEPKIFIKKLKDHIPHFGAEQSSRIPENDPSKHYKFNLEKYNLKASIDEWKLKKALEKQPHKKPSKSNNLRMDEPKSSSVKKIVLSRKGSRLNSFLEKPSYVKLHGKLNENSTEKSIPEKAENGLTLRKLSEMPQSELLKGEYFLGNLISEASSDEETFAKYLFKNSSSQAVFNKDNSQFQGFFPKGPSKYFKK